MGAFAAFGGFTAARSEGAGIPGAIIASALLAGFFGGIVWLIGVMTAGPATDRVRRLVRRALGDATLAGTAAEPGVAADSQPE